jgi:hypothetical protein
MAYRIMYTAEGVEGGWYKDVEAPDIQTATWNQAVACVGAPQLGGATPVLVSVTDLAVPRQDG